MNNNKIITSIINGFTVASLEQMAFSKPIKTVSKQLKRIKAHIFKDAEALNSSMICFLNRCASFKPSIHQLHIKLIRTFRFYITLHTSFINTLPHKAESFGAL